jgi:hypothetical protein
MPLLDHFHPPLSVSHPWKGFHSAWANAITNHLNDVLPEGYYAVPEVPLAEVDFTRVQVVEVHVFQDAGGPQLRAAIELASPANKDRPRSRLTFAGKCAAYLERGVGLVVVDTVTTRRANLHAELAAVLEVTADMDWDSPSSLAAVAYRTVAQGGQTRVEAWPEPLAVGDNLPTLPLWFGPDLCLPLPLEETYGAACHSLRIGPRP